MDETDFTAPRSIAPYQLLYLAHLGHQFTPATLHSTGGKVSIEVEPGSELEQQLDDSALYEGYVLDSLAAEPAQIDRVRQEVLRAYAHETPRVIFLDSAQCKPFL
jgi:hypothetical protein